MGAASSLSLAECTVLAILDEEPAHGFAIAAQTAADGSLGRVWQVPRPVVYRAIGRLEGARLAEPVGQEQGRGPRRQLHRATPGGRAAVRRWLDTPVEHVRDVRSHLLMKLALLERRAEDPTPLLSQQRALLEPIVAGLADDEDVTGFDATLVVWRRASATAALAFVDELLVRSAQVSGR